MVSSKEYVLFLNQSDDNIDGRTKLYHFLCTILFHVECQFLIQMIFFHFYIFILKLIYSDLVPIFMYLSAFAFAF